MTDPDPTIGRMPARGRAHGLTNRQVRASVAADRRASPRQRRSCRRSARCAHRRSPGDIAQYPRRGPLIVRRSEYRSASSQRSITSLCQRVGTRPRLANCSSTRAIVPGSGTTSIEKQKTEARSWFAAPASQATAALGDNRSGRNMGRATFDDVEKSGFAGALAGGPAGNSRARNSSKACVHAATLSRDGRRVNRLAEVRNRAQVSGATRAEAPGVALTATDTFVNRDRTQIHSQY